MNTDLTLLTTFPTVRDATPLLSWLDENKVPYELKQPRKHFDVSFAFNGQFDTVGVFVAQDRHKDLIARLKKEELLSDSEDDLLAEFSEKELREVMKKADEWEADEVARAEALLQKKGIHFSEEEKAAMLAQRKAEVHHPKPIPLPVLILGVFFGISGWMVALGIWLGIDFFPKILGSFAGVFTLLSIGMGWIFTFLTRKDPWGEEYLVYDARTRQWGWVMLFLGSGMVLVFVAGIIANYLL